MAHHRCRKESGLHRRPKDRPLPLVLVLAEELEVWQVRQVEDWMDEAVNLRRLMDSVLAESQVGLLPQREP